VQQKRPIPVISTSAKQPGEKSFQGPYWISENKKQLLSFWELSKPICNVISVGRSYSDIFIVTLYFVNYSCFTRTREAETFND